MRDVVDRLARHALVNHTDFASDRDLVLSYERALSTPGAMVYALDGPETGCSSRDCWSSWRELVEPLGGARAVLDGSAALGSPEVAIALDCEDDASALAAWLELAEPGSAWVGVVPGRRISHAIAGVTRAGESEPRALDPAVWHGMPGARTLDYRRALWARLADYMRGGQ